MNRHTFPIWIFAAALLFLRPVGASDASDPTKTVPWSAPDLERAKEFARQVPPLVTEAREIGKVGERRIADMRTFYLNNSLFDFLLLNMDYDSFLLDSPIIRKEEDFYQPVRFMHAKHAALAQDCSLCHHMVPAGSEDSVKTRCSACHQESFNLTVFGRLGLKGSYHRLCMKCHENSPNNKNAPTDCIGCHGTNVPDHAELVELKANPRPSEVTRECLRCHDDQAEDFLTSTHWLWKQSLSEAEKREEVTPSGKATTGINNSCIALPGNWSRCTSCHCGYGWSDENFDFSDKSHIDCLVCHDTTGMYKKDPEGSGMPMPGIDLALIARNVGKPSRATCGACHFQDMNGDPTRHAYLNGLLQSPSRQFDVHMGGHDFQCQDCHKTRQHKISGKSSSLPNDEGTFSCQGCHTESPHNQGALIYHLNDHSKHVACTTCHSPLYAKSSPTKTWWDWSKAGDRDRAQGKNPENASHYAWEFGELQWEKNLKPTYAWYTGEMRRSQIGDPLTTSTVFNITEPMGSIHDPRSKIHAFQVLRGRQPADSATNILLVPRLAGPEGFWETLDWDKAFANGMRDVGLSYSGSHEWRDTAMYWGVEHEVMPKEFATPCSQCHESLRTERTCDRCHQDSQSLDYRALSNGGWDRKRDLPLDGGDSDTYREGLDYINFKALGYEGDPIEVGGRFKILPLGRPTKARPAEIDSPTLGDE